MTAKELKEKSMGHQWDDAGERCLKCGDKDWFADPECAGDKQQRDELKMGEFKREQRYVVFKLEDLRRYCSDFISSIERVGQIITEGRALDGKQPFNAVVVEEGWPEFEIVWDAIEARTKMTPSDSPDNPPRLCEHSGVIDMNQRLVKMFGLPAGAFSATLRMRAGQPPVLTVVSRIFSIGQLEPTQKHDRYRLVPVENDDSVEN